jgi:hypothetical protein
MTSSLLDPSSTLTIRLNELHLNYLSAEESFCRARLEASIAVAGLLDESATVASRSSQYGLEDSSIDITETSSRGSLWFSSRIA